MTPTRKELSQASQTFCNAFAEKKNLAAILSLFSTTHEVSVVEHGLPILAPFLGRSFIGISGAQQYFRLISSLLSYDSISFSDYVVDPESMKVSVKGKGTFTWLSTKQSWDEIFIYTLDFDDELKVVQYQIWADSGAAYLAWHGELSHAKSCDI
ncbi:hypothetical protein BDN70DRAFT_873180 [Pholiota conissans]|uniref:SnoaL-like domain-containing protein n=1 Tax=Pholiota conissans TaxID=109636 RepID=A0A9P5Z9C6_9AGAR|nr:hypothetical protein BDN70DRAFT_873180 [Pholiota conissans]